MKLYEIFNQQYIILEGEWYLAYFNISRDDDDYYLSYTKNTSLNELKKTNPLVWSEIKDNGAEDEDENEQSIRIYDGYITSQKDEPCTIYVPNFWQ